MKTLTREQLKEVVHEYVDANKIANGTFIETRDNTVGLLDKIAKTFTIPSVFRDKLSIFDGETLTFGKTLEEWKSDLILPEDYDITGAHALESETSTYRPVSYSFTLGRKQFPQTIKNNDIERAVNNQAEFEAIINDKSKVLFDSEVLFRYQLKKEALADLIKNCEATDVAGLQEASNTKTYAVNDLVKVGETPYIVFKAYTASSLGSVDLMISEGYLVALDLVSKIAKPVDTTTGENFIEQVKKDVEIASDSSWGHSLNGGVLGESEMGLVLVVKQGIMPNIDVKTLSGAFNTEKVTLPAQVIVVNDFGSYDGSAYAVLMDARGMRLHNTYRAVRTQENASGDWIKYILHTENTVHISRNTFVKVYKEAQ